MTEEAQPVTFRTLAEADGISLPKLLPQDWPLEKWFAALLDVPLLQFSVEDLARACRQQMWPDHIVPICLDALSLDPLVGEFYEGELLCSFNSIPAIYWRAHPNDAHLLLNAVERAWDREESDVFLRTDILRLIASVVE